MLVLRMHYVSMYHTYHTYRRTTYHVPRSTYRVQFLRIVIANHEPLLWSLGLALPLSVAV